MPRTSAGSAFEGCAAHVDLDLAALLGQLTRLDLSKGTVPMAAADAAALIMSCTALRWLGAPAVRQPGARSSWDTVIPRTLQAHVSRNVSHCLRCQCLISTQTGPRCCPRRAHLLGHEHISRPTVQIACRRC